MDVKRIAIIGANWLSVSIALGLKAQKNPPEIVGYDIEAVAADLARSQGAFDRVELKTDRACRNADLVVVATPLSAIREVFTAIAPHLQPGCLVTDTAPLKAPVMHWAEELLPESVSFIGGHLIPNPAIVGFDFVEGLDTASADLLREALYCFITPTSTSRGVISACARLAEALDAHPFFMDVTEHDGLQAGVEGLPDLLAIALLRATVDTPGWEEMRKFAGRRFAIATEAADDALEHYSALFLNREHVVRRLNVLLNELIHLRDLLTQEDAGPLEETFAATAKGRARWIRERERGMWIKERIVDTEHIPSMGQRIGQLIFGDRMASRLENRPDRSSEK